MGKVKDAALRNAQTNDEMLADPDKVLQNEVAVADADKALNQRDGFTAPVDGDAAEDYSDDVDSGPTDAQLNLIGVLGKQQTEIKARIEKLLALLTVENDKLKRNREIDLPAAMSNAKQEECTLAGGYVAELKNNVVAGIPAANPTPGLNYMMKERPDLVKHVILIEFGMKETKMFQKLLRDFAQRKVPINAEIKDSVHGGTLGKYVRDMDKEGKAVPEDILGVHRFKTVDVKPPKKAKDKV